MNQQQEENLPDKIQITQTNQNALLYSVDDVPPWHLSTIIFVSGIITLLQCTLGVRYLLFVLQFQG
jgi:hypothetical protein